MPHPGRRARQLRLEQRKTLEEVAKAAQTDTGNLSRFERELQGVSGKRLHAIATYLGTTVAALYDDVPTEIVESTGSAADKVTATVRRRPFCQGEVALLSIDAVAQWAATGAANPDDVRSMIGTADDYSGARAAAVQIFGDAMRSPTGDGILDGAIVIVVVRDPQHGNLVLAQQSQSEMPYVRRLTLEGGRKFLSPLNDRYPVEPLSGSILGVVTESITYRRHVHC